MRADRSGRAAYGRAVDFVAQNNLKYNLSSDRLEELGEHLHTVPVNCTHT